MKEPTQDQPKMYISRQQYAHLAAEVLRHICSSQVVGEAFVVVGIANGGNLFAQFLAERLNLPLVLVHPNYSPMPISALNHLEERKVLLVDDISDSGETLRSWRDYLQAKGCLVEMATLFERVGTEVSPRYVGLCIEDVDWLVFWWEPEYVWTKEDIEREHVI